MAKQTHTTRRLAQLSLLLALEVILAFTPIGMIQIPPISLTIMHIPVIIGGILLGCGSGAFLGGAFGVLSMIRATFAAAGPGDIIFNPAASGNPLGSILMAVVPRILLGLVAAGVYQLLASRTKPTFALVAAIIPACLIHSLGVLGCMSLLFDQLPLQGVFEVIISFNGLIELGVAVVAGTAICRAVLASQKKTM